MLRSYLLSLFLLMAANSLLAVNSLNLYLQLPDQGQQAQCFPLNEHPVITFSGDFMQVSTDSVKVKYEINRTRPYFIYEDEPSSVVAPVRNYVIDVNGDGLTSIADASIIIYIILGGRDSFNDDAVRAADVNGDGLITIADAMTIVSNILNGNRGTGVSRTLYIHHVDGTVDSVAVYDIVKIESQDDSIAVMCREGMSQYAFAAVDHLSFSASLPDAYKIPMTHKSFALFGSSKTTTRDARSGWLTFLLDSLRSQGNMATAVTVSGTEEDMPASVKTALTTGHKITGVGSSIEFSVYGDHIDIVQMLERTQNYAEFDIYDNGVRIGSYDNRNKTMLGRKTETFTGDGSKRTFELEYVDSYNFEVTVDGTSKSVSMAPLASVGTDCIAPRMINAEYKDGVTRRIIHFFTAPPAGSQISVSYDVGHTVGYCQSDYNETDDSTVIEDYNCVRMQTDATGDLVYGFNITTPVWSNDVAVLSIDLDRVAMHRIKIVLTGGENPYFDYDFAIAAQSAWMNAALGGFGLDDMTIEFNYLRDWRMIRFMPNPDVILMEFGTNDEQSLVDVVHVTEQTFTMEQLRDLKMKNVTYVVNNGDTTYNVGLCYGQIDSIAENCLWSADIKTSDIEVGDYIKIGEYHSDCREYVVRTVIGVDKENGVVTWDVPVAPDAVWHYHGYDELANATFAVRRLGMFKNYYRRLMSNFRQTCPNAEYLFVGISAFNNNDYCSGWAYDEAMQEIVAENGAQFVGIKEEQMAFNDEMLCEYEMIDVTSTGASDYEVPASAYNNANRAMRVLVNGVDVTGVDAWVERTDGWRLKDYATPDMITTPSKGATKFADIMKFSADYPKRALKIHFYGKVPTAADTIQLKIAKAGWSTEGVHQTDEGNRLYASKLWRFLF